MTGAGKKNPAIRAGQGSLPTLWISCVFGEVKMNTNHMTEQKQKSFSYYFQIIYKRTISKDPTTFFRFFSVV